MLSVFLVPLCSVEIHIGGAKGPPDRVGFPWSWFSLFRHYRSSLLTWLALFCCSVGSSVQHLRFITGCESLTFCSHLCKTRVDWGLCFLVGKMESSWCSDLFFFCMLVRSLRCRLKKCFHFVLRCYLVFNVQVNMWG